jgi:hypothetical protein
MSFSIKNLVGNLIILLILLLTMPNPWGLIA